MNLNKNYQIKLLKKFNNNLNLINSLSNLVILNVKHYDFNNKIQTGKIICNKDIASDLLYIFEQLYKNKYQIEKINIIDNYDFDDIKSMENNNTSCFNFRKIKGTNEYSKHAYGLALDINPLYNPYYVNENTILPNKKYINRELPFKHKIDENDLCYKLFIERDFVWGGNWKYPDYQHFEKKEEKLNSK